MFSTSSNGNSDSGSSLNSSTTVTSSSSNTPTEKIVPSTLSSEGRSTASAPAESSTTGTNALDSVSTADSASSTSASSLTKKSSTTTIVDGLKRLDLEKQLAQAQQASNTKQPGVSGGVQISTTTGLPVADRKADRAKFYSEHNSKLGDLDKFTGDKFDRFNAWLLENGALIPDLYMHKYTENVRGVHASRDIEPHSQIVYIPRKCLIMETMGRKTKIGHKVQTALRNNEISLSVPNHCQVIIYMLTTIRDPDHFFQPYYEILPMDFDNFPIFWSDEELKWLKGSHLLSQIADRKANIRSDYDNICAAAPEFGEMVDFKRFMWCRTAVGSRNFGIVVDQQKRTAMVPYADMLNHFRPRETSWTFDNTQQGFTMTSLHKIRASQQVMDSYGKKCNSKFLLHYGFTIERNREEDGRCQNELHIGFSMGQRKNEDPLMYERRVALLLDKQKSGSTSSTGLDGEVTPMHTWEGRLTMNFDDSSTAEALSFNRIAALNASELDHLSKQHKTSKNLRPQSIRNELAALERITECCRKQLKRYPTTYEEDQKLLESQAPFSNRRHAYIAVMGEKEICHWWITLFEEAKTVFSTQTSGLFDPLTQSSADFGNDLEKLQKKDRKRYLRDTLLFLNNNL